MKQKTFFSLISFLLFLFAIDANAQKILTINDYDGLDPEISGGIERNIYPPPFTTVLGVNLNF